MNKGHLLLERYLNTHQNKVSKIVDFNAFSDKLYPINLTEDNAELTRNIVSDTHAFTEWINNKLSKNMCRYGYGGYNENRSIYNRSPLFNSDEEPRTLHLGVDIWGQAGTPVYCPLDSKVHSFKNNNGFGDYGPTIILEHRLDSLRIFSLYGHLSTSSIQGLYKGQMIRKGELFTEFGTPEENGNWPPHLHFQLILDMKGLEGDFPGVCKYEEREMFLQNCPDANLISKFSFL